MQINLIDTSINVPNGAHKNCNFDEIHLIDEVLYS